jgi:hypothetical protein
VISLRDATGPANILTEDEHIQVFSMSFGRGERSRTCVLWNGFLLSKRKEEAEQDLHRPLFWSDSNQRKGHVRQNKPTVEVGI